MTTFPSITGNRLIRGPHKFGFEVIRVKGSHHFLQHQDGRCTVVPQHRGESIGRGLLVRIVELSNWTAKAVAGPRSEFEKVL